MISAAYNIGQFIDAVKGKDYFEIIQMADQEALDAWRQSLRCSEKSEAEQYEIMLKTFVYAVKSDIAITKNFPNNIKILYEKTMFIKPSRSR